MKKTLLLVALASAPAFGIEFCPHNASWKTAAATGLAVGAGSTAVATLSHVYNSWDSTHPGRGLNQGITLGLEGICNNWAQGAILGGAATVATQFGPGHAWKLAHLNKPILWALGGVALTAAYNARQNPVLGHKNNINALWLGGAGVSLYAFYMRNLR